MDDLAVVSERNIEETLNAHLDLYNPRSPHEERLLRCVKDLARFVADKEECPFDDDFWFGFHTWAKGNTDKATGYANAFLSDYLNAKGHQSSAGHTVRLYVSIWRKWDIHISSTARAQLKTFEHDVWAPAKVSRLASTQAVKATQYSKVEPMWERVVDYLRTVKPTEFRQQINNILDNRGKHPGVAAASFHEMVAVSNKSDLRVVLDCTLAYVSLLRFTGMRSITGLDISLGDFEVQDDGTVLLTRVEHKVGNVRNVDKLVYCRLVPHKNPSQCVLLHLARFFATTPNLPQQPFAFGFKRGGGDRLVFSKLPQKRSISILHVACIACGLVEGLSGPKKLHLLRMICENTLATRGASPNERQLYIGWSNSVQSKNYSVLKLCALQSNCPYLMANRTSKEDPPHPMWKCFGDVPGVNNYWQRVYHLAVAAGVYNDDTVTIDDDFKAEVHRVIKRSSPPSNSNKRALLKRLREVEEELRQVKRAKIVIETTTTTPMEDLCKLVTELHEKCHQHNYPVQCAAAFPRLKTLIDATSTASRSFGIPLSSTLGKHLRTILILAAWTKKPTYDNNKGVTYRSWSSFAKAEAKPGGKLHGISTRTWNEYQED